MSEQAILDEAFAAAKKAEADFRAQHGEPMYCGFAWVNVKPGTSKIAKLIKAGGHGRSDSYYGGVTVWNPGGSNTQSMDIKETGARAFANVLQAHGIRASAMSRPD